MELRAASDPGWDPSEARWRVMLTLMGKAGGTADYMATPGTFTSHERRKAECRDLYLHAERYPADVCDVPLRRLRPPLPRLLWKSLVGGTMVPDDFKHVGVDDVIGGEGFAEARALYDETTRPEGSDGHVSASAYDRVLVRARAIGDARSGRGASGG